MASNTDLTHRQSSRIYMYTILTSVQVFRKVLCYLFEAQIQCQTISLGKNHNHGNPQYFHLHTFDPPIHPQPAKKMSGLNLNFKLRVA